MSEFPDLKGLLETAQRIQEGLARSKEALGAKTVEAESGGGLVRCVVSGQGDLVSLTLDPVTLTDKRMLEDLVVAAVNLAIERARQLARDEMGRATGGLSIPPGFLGGLGG